MTSLKTRRWMGLGLLLLCGSLTVQAQPRGRWQYLGEANVDGGRDHDMINVAGQGTFRAIQIKVQNAAIQFDRVVVHYGNGSSEPIQIRSVIPAGGQTRVIDLPGQRRIVQGVEFYYGKANGDWSRRRPKVRLFGLK